MTNHSSMTIFISSPNLSQLISLNGISANTLFIIENNKEKQYIHFEQGKRDHEIRGVFWVSRLLKNILIWLFVVPFKKHCLVHYNLPLNKSALIRDLPFIFYAKLFRKKLIIHIHGGVYLMDTLPPKLVIVLLRILFSSSMPVIVLSEKEEQSIRSTYHAKSTFVLPNCVPLRNHGTVINEQEKTVSLRILYLGRIVESKGVSFICDALVLLKQRNVDFRFILAGDGPLLESFLPKFTEALGSQFEYRGIVIGEDKERLFSDCHVFVLPSISGEGLPIALLESMSYGLVPIVTTDGSMNAVVKHGINGLIVNKRSAEAIAEAVMLIQANPKIRLQLASEAKATIALNYNADAYITQLNLIYSYA